MVEVMKIMATSFRRSHAHSMPPTSRPPPAHASSGDSGHSRASPGQSHVGSLLLSSGSWCTRFCCPLRESISQSCVSSCISMVGLMPTSSKRAYAIPKTAAPRASVPVAYHHQPAPPQETLKHSSLSVSVGSLHPCALKVCLSPLSISGRNGV